MNETSDGIVELNTGGDIVDSELAKRVFILFIASQMRILIGQVIAEISHWSLEFVVNLYHGLISVVE